MPNEKADRLTEPVLTASEVGVLTGGALFVYTPSAPMHEPTTEDIAHAAEEGWLMGAYTSNWRVNPDSGPKVLIGLNGPISRRFTTGAFEIDTRRWDADEDKLGGLNRRVPLLDRTQGDAFQLQGRRIDPKFAQGRHDHWKWVDAAGVVHKYDPAGLA